MSEFAKKLQKEYKKLQHVQQEREVTIFKQVFIKYHKESLNLDKTRLSSIESQPKKVVVVVVVVGVVVFVVVFVVVSIVGNKNLTLKFGQNLLLLMSLF